MEEGGTKAALCKEEVGGNIALCQDQGGEGVARLPFRKQNKLSF